MYKLLFYSLSTVKTFIFFQYWSIKCYNIFVAAEIFFFFHHLAAVFRSHQLFFILALFLWWNFMSLFILCVDHHFLCNLGNLQRNLCHLYFPSVLDLQSDFHHFDFTYYSSADPTAVCCLLTSWSWYRPCCSISTSFSCKI